MSSLGVVHVHDMTNAGGTRASRWAGGLLACIALGGVVLGVPWGSSREQPAGGPLGAPPTLLELSGPEEFERLLLGLRSYQYRARRRAGSSVREYYYDTEDWALARAGRAYAFDVRLGDDGVPTYSLRLAGVPGEQSSEITALLPAQVGDAIAAGAWERALPGRLPAASGEPLAAGLATLGIAEERLAVRGVADATLEHFDVRDKGRTWFELDYEQWVFSGRGPGSGSATPFHWYGIALRPGGGPENEEFRERIRQMERVLPTFYRFRPQAEPRHVRAVAALRGRG